MPSMSKRVSGFATTIFTEINDLALQHGAVNLGQGRPDFDGPPEVIEAAERALRDGVKQARRYAGELADDAQESSRKFVKYANQELRDHPFAAFGAGLAIGALIGMVVASRVNED